MTRSENNLRYYGNLWTILLPLGAFVSWWNNCIVSGQKAIAIRLTQHIQLAPELAMHRTRNVLHKTPKLLFSFTGAGAWNARKGRHYPAHKHTYWEIVYYQAGNIGATIGDESYDVSPGMVLITPPQTLHSETARTAYSNFYIGIDAPAEFPWPRVCFDSDDREFQRICGAIVKEWTASKPQRAAMLSSLLNQLVILIQRNADRVPPGEALVRRAEQLINQGFAACPVIKDIAREAGASVSSLRAHFSRLRNCSTARSFACRQGRACTFFAPHLHPHA